jgi:hypothetical protein
MSKNPDGSYDVGYGKPPKANRFKPGKSGNPKGRPKAPPKFEDLMAKEANKSVTATVDGVKKTLLKGEVVVKAIMQKAMQGDVSCAKLVILGLQAFPHEPEDEGAISAHELAVLKEILQEANPATKSSKP